MFTGPEVVGILTELGYTHVVWVPDSALGPWEEALEASDQLRLIRVCREGEAWPLAAGLYLGGKQPLVVMQTTGLFESGDALRNALFDLKLPLTALIGARSYLVENSPDTALKFSEPVLRAWGIDYKLIASETDKPQLAAHLGACLLQRQPGAVLMAEGRM